MNILYLVQKDLDLKIISELVNLGHSVETVCFRHRDYLEAKQKGLSGLISFPEYWKEIVESNISPEIRNIQLRELVNKYSLRNIARYSFLDLSRSRKPNIDLSDDEEITYSLIKMFNDLDVGRFDFCVGELSKSFNLICYDICKKENVEYLHYINANFEKGMLFTDDKFNIVTLDKRWDELCEEEKNLNIEFVKNKVSKFKENPVYTLTSINKKSVSLGTFISRLVMRLKVLRLEIESYGVDKLYRIDQYYVNPIKRFISNNKLFNYKLFINKMKWEQIGETALPEEDYFYFSLHVQPETTTSLYSEYLIDDFSQQGWLIEQLAKQLPQGTRLLVKDHPYMLDKRMAKLYQRLASYPQVCFMVPWYNQFDIIKNSKGVITAVGTVGVEARMLDKPVCLLENTYYSSMNVFAADAVKQVQIFYNEMLGSSVESQQIDENEIVFLSKLKNAIYEGVENAIIEFFPGQESKDNINKLIDGILKEYEYRKQ